GRPELSLLGRADRGGTGYRRGRRRSRPLAGHRPGAERRAQVGSNSAAAPRALPAVPAAGAAPAAGGPVVPLPRPPPPRGRAPRPDEGAGRATWARARGAAALGHEAHFLTRSPDHNRVDFEDGVWVHRLVPEKEGPWGAPEVAPTVRADLAHAAAAHKEVRRIRQWRHVDLVDVALPGTDGLFCLQDNDLTCVATLHATGPDAPPRPP